MEMRLPLIHLATVFLDEAKRLMELSRIHGNKQVRLACKEEALDSLDNALCCRSLPRLYKLEIVSIREQYLKEMSV